MQYDILHNSTNQTWGKYIRIVLNESEYQNQLWVCIQARVLHLVNVFRYESEYMNMYSSTSTTLYEVKRPFWIYGHISQVGNFLKMLGLYFFKKSYLQIYLW